MTSPSAPDTDICISERLSHSRTSDIGYVWARSAQTMGSTFDKANATAEARCQRVGPMATVREPVAALVYVEPMTGFIWRPADGERQATTTVDSERQRQPPWAHRSCLFSIAKDDSSRRRHESRLESDGGLSRLTSRRLWVGFVVQHEPGRIRGVDRDKAARGRPKDSKAKLGSASAGVLGGWRAGGARAVELCAVFAKQSRLPRQTQEVSDLAVLCSRAHSAHTMSLATGSAGMCPLYWMLGEEATDRVAVIESLRRHRGSSVIEA